MLDSVMAILNENPLPVLIIIGFISFFFWDENADGIAKYLNMAEILFLSSPAFFEY